MIYPREVYAWMRKRIREVHKPLSLTAAIEKRGGMDNYSPFGALLLYVHRDAVVVVDRQLRKPFLQLDGRQGKLDGKLDDRQGKLDATWMNVAHCVACHERTACETAIWDDCRPEGKQNAGVGGVGRRTLR